MNNSQMSAMDRITSLLDDHSFVELGSYVAARNTDFTREAQKVRGDGVITGYGIIGDRMVYVFSQDASLLGGSVGEMHAAKITRLYDMAMKTGTPVVGMLDCAGLRLQEAYDALHAFGSLFDKQMKASGMIPQIMAVFGMCGGGSALVSSLSDFTFMVKDQSSMFINSPNTLAGNSEETKDTSSAVYQASKAGTVDFLCENEEEMLEKIAELIDLLPSSWNSEDIFAECSDNLNRIIPELAESAYDARFILKEISDDHLYIETKKEYAPDMVTAMIRLNGQTIGAVANAGFDGEMVLTNKGLSKAARFIRFCDAFSIPVLTITNVKGFRANEHEEKRLSEAMASFVAVLAECTVPKINLIAGEAYGTAGVIMNSKALGADFVLAWPDACVGMMDADKAVRIIYANEIDASDDKLTLIAQKRQQYQEMQSSALAAASRGYVDDIIEPDATRKRLIMAFEMLFDKKETRPAKKHPAL